MVPLGLRSGAWLLLSRYSALTPNPRPSYSQARALLDGHTAVRGPGTGWDLDERRRSSLTHLREAGASLLKRLSPITR